MKRFALATITTLLRDTTNLTAREVTREEVGKLSNFHGLMDTAKADFYYIEETDDEGCKSLDALLIVWENAATYLYSVYTG